MRKFTWISVLVKQWYIERILILCSFVDRGGVLMNERVLRREGRGRSDHFLVGGSLGVSQRRERNKIAGSCKEVVDE